MTGMFPNAGVPAAQTANAEPNVEVVAACNALFHPNRCVPRFDPASANAVMSEILNAINLVIPYDCTRLDNLASAMQALVNLCGFTNKSALATDFLAGCFAGQNGKATVRQVLELAPALYQEVSSIIGDERIGAARGPTPEKIPITAIRDWILSQIVFPDSRVHVTSTPTISMGGDGTAGNPLHADYIGPAPARIWQNTRTPTGGTGSFVISAAQMTFPNNVTLYVPRNNGENACNWFGVNLQGDYSRTYNYRSYTVYNGTLWGVEGNVWSAIVGAAANVAFVAYYGGVFRSGSSGGGGGGDVNFFVGNADVNLSTWSIVGGV